jgi:hypothetical protein
LTTRACAVDVVLRIVGLQVGATVTEAGLTDVRLVGALPRAPFEAALMSLVTGSNSDVSWTAIQPLLPTLYDVQLGDGCDGLSVGLLATAAREPAP